MDADELHGVFPVDNPIPYTGRTEILSLENIPAVRTWYHGTWTNRVASIARLGLLPSCWFGGQCCCVFGFDALDSIPYHKYGDWIIEIRSRVDPETHAKAWWVPSQWIIGAWNKGQFYIPERLFAIPGDTIPPGLGQLGCSDKLCARQYEIWCATYSGSC